MNILVCIKQVPDTTEIKINPETNTLIREGVPSIVNPYDAYALEGAARIKDKNPDTKIVVVSMGPEQAKNALKEALAIAADKAYLVTDRAFGGSDTLATSYILSQAVKKIEELEGKFDAIFCGKQAIDGDTAQVGPEMAEHLDYPQVTYALEVMEEADGIVVLKEDEDYNLKIKVQTPCVLTFTKPSFEPRYPNVRRKMAANRTQIPNITAGDLLEIDLTKAGLKGSPTKVKKTFVPDQKKSGVKIQKDNSGDAVKELIQFLGQVHIV